MFVCGECGKDENAYNTFKIKLLDHEDTYLWACLDCEVQMYKDQCILCGDDTRGKVCHDCIKTYKIKDLLQK